MADNPVSQSELAKALDDLILQDTPPPLAADEFTAGMIAKIAKCHNQQARRRIARWIAEGKAEYVGKRREPRGQSVDAWRLMR
jgi:hypothetical protein